MEYGQPRESQYSTTFDAEYKEESYNTNGTTKVAKFQPNGDISGQSPVESAFNQRHQVWPISTTSPFGDSNRNLTYRPAYETTRNPQPIPQRNFPLTMTEATPINYTIYQTPDKLMNQRSPEMRKPSETDFSGSPQSTPPKILSPRVFLPVSQVYSAVIPLVGIGLVASVLAILNLQLIFAITTGK